MKFSFALFAAALFSGTPAAAQLGSDDEGDVRCNPDPHFKTWDDEHYDYHGGCDLVLIRNSLLDLHIRTFPVTGFSFISHAALKLGGDILEVRDDTSYYLNGVLQTSTPTLIGGKPFTITSTSGGTTYELTLDNGQFARIERWGPPSGTGSLSVHVHGHGSDFSDSSGMGGMWTIPGLVGRDFVTYTNTTEFALTWQVDSGAGDPTLLMDPGVPTCLPDNTFSGCIGDQGGGCDLVECKVCVTRDEVEAACAHIEDEDLQANCEFDVEMTGNVEWGKAPFYQDFIPPPQSDARCYPNKGDLCSRRYGGSCVWECIETKYSKCLPNLCTEAGKPSRPWGQMDSSTLRLGKPGRPLKDIDIEHPECDCSCKVRTPGYYHNEVLTYLQNGGGPNVTDVTADSTGDLLINPILDAAADYMTNKLYTEDDLTKEIAEHLKILIEGRLFYNVDSLNSGFSSLLHVLGGLRPDCRVSRELEGALYSVYHEVQDQNDRGRDNMEGYLDTVVKDRIINIEWDSDKDQEFVDTFINVYEASEDYWGRNGGTGSTRRRGIPKWVTRLADALGAALGGAVGAAGAGPIGAGIGAGLMGAAASHVFS